MRSFPFFVSIEPLKEIVTYYRMALNALVRANANIIENGLLTKKQFVNCQQVSKAIYPTAL